MTTPDYVHLIIYVIAGWALMAFWFLFVEWRLRDRGWTRGQRIWLFGAYAAVTLGPLGAFTLR